MSSCHHSQWLDVQADQTEWTIIDPDRLLSIRDALPDPEVQKPVVVFFLGKLKKSATINSILAQAESTKRRPHGIANLYTDQNTAVSKHPLIVADCTIGASTSFPADLWKGCHTHQQIVVSHHGDKVSVTKHTAVSELFARLLFPLAHIVCLVAIDFGGNAACGAYVASLMRIRARNASPVVNTAPELIIITEDANTIDVFIQLECEPVFGDLFGGLAIVTTDSRMADSVTALDVRQIFEATMADVLDVRAARSLLFSARDLERLFVHGLKQFAEGPRTSFDAFSSIDHPIKQLAKFHQTYHIGEFLKRTQTLKLSMTVVSSFIVTAIFAQSYPEGTHRKAITIHAIQPETDIYRFRPRHRL